VTSVYRADVRILGPHSGPYVQLLQRGIIILSAEVIGTLESPVFEVHTVERHSHQRLDAEAGVKEDGDDLRGLIGDGVLDDSLDLNLDPGKHTPIALFLL